MDLELTPSQTKFACALTQEFVSIREIKRTRIYDGPMARVGWRELVNLQIAEMRGKGAGVILRRGLKWYDFFARTGYEDTLNGCEFIGFMQDLFEIFRRDNVVCLKDYQML